MRPKPEPQAQSRTAHLFQPLLVDLLDNSHELFILAGKIDWKWIDAELSSSYAKIGRAGIASRMMAGLHLLKHAKVLSDEEVFREPFYKAFLIQTQKPRDKEKIYSWHAPEVECIGKGKAHRPYEFGLKVSVTTPLKRSAGGLFVLHSEAIAGRPFDGHTLNRVIENGTKLTGVKPKRIYADKGYKGHGYPEKRVVFLSGQKRGVTQEIQKELNRRSAVEPVIGHMKTDGHLGRNFLHGADGDKINAILCGAGHNMRLLLKWFVTVLLQFLEGLLAQKRKLEQCAQAFV